MEKSNWIITSNQDRDEYAVTDKFTNLRHERGNIIREVLLDMTYEEANAVMEDMMEKDLNAPASLDTLAGMRVYLKETKKKLLDTTMKAYIQGAFADKLLESLNKKEYEVK